MLSIGSLFAGIGGLESGIEAGLGALGHRAGTAWQVECNAYSASVLAREWPLAARYPDVATVRASELAPVDMIVGGSPCQDLSLIGHRRGLEGARSGLWRHYARLVRALQPPIVVWENVGGALCPTRDKATGQRRTPAVLAVLADLHELGYDAAWFVLPAAAVGAPHLRERVFVVARARDGIEQGHSSATAALGRSPIDLTGASWPAPPGFRQQPGEPSREIPSAAFTSSVKRWHQERIEALGNCVVPQVAAAVAVVVANMAAPRPNPPRLAFRALPLVQGARIAAHLLPHMASLPTWRGIELDRMRWPIASPPLQVPTWGVAVGGIAWAVEPAPGIGASMPVACSADGSCDGADAIEVAGLWPTVITRDWRSGRASAVTRAKNARPLSEVAAPRGFLSPEWVEVLCGFPAGYTAPGPGFPPPRLRGSKPCAAP